MVTISREAKLAAPAARVWEVASPPPSWPDWLSLHLRWPTPPPATIDVGSTFVEQVSLLNIPIAISWTITEYAAASRFAMHGTGALGVGLTIGFDLTDAGEETAIALVVELEGALMVGSLKSAVQRYADTHLEASLTRLAALLD
jgi:hypothetical protein